MPKTTKPTQKMFYGSGSIYEIELTAGITIPTTKAEIAAFVDAYAIEENQIGYLKGGFQVEVSTDTLEDQSDLGEMKISLITQETATISFALFNANAETLTKLYPTARTTDGVTVVGGLKGTTQSDHVLIFVAADETEGQTVVIAIGKNTSGFTLNWNPDSVEPFACEYAVVPYNTEGNFLVVSDITDDDFTIYNIFYVTNDGTWAADYTAPTTYTAESGTVTLPTSSDIERTGYTFGGWFEETDLSTAVTTIDAATETGSKTFIAKWTET